MKKDLLLCVKKLRPDVTWANDMVNPHSLETIAKTYQSAEPIPTLEECEAVWPEIEAEHATEKQRSIDIKAERETAGLKNISIAQAHAFIDNQIDGASTIAETKEAIKAVLKKMIPYLLQ
jgi:hypothetical protein